MGRDDGRAQENDHREDGRQLPGAHATDAMSRRATSAHAGAKPADDAADEQLPQRHLGHEAFAMPEGVGEHHSADDQAQAVHQAPVTGRNEFFVLKKRVTRYQRPNRGVSGTDAADQASQPEQHADAQPDENAAIKKRLPTQGEPLRNTVHQSHPVLVGRSDMDHFFCILRSVGEGLHAVSARCCSR